MANATIGHNRPTVLVELTQEQAQFLVENCDANLGLGLTVLGSIPKDTVNRERAEKVVAMIEQFKSLKSAVTTALEK